MVMRELIEGGFNGMWKVCCTSKSSIARCNGALLMIFNVTTKIKSVNLLMFTEDKYLRQLTRQSSQPQTGLHSKGFVLGDICHHQAVFQKTSGRKIHTTLRINTLYNMVIRWSTFSSDAKGNWLENVLKKVHFVCCVTRFLRSYKMLTIIYQ